MSKATEIADLKKMASSLINASIKSKIDVSIQFDSCVNEQERVQIVFFNTYTSTTIALYKFWTLETNKKLAKLAKEAIKKGFKIEEIKEKMKKIGRE